MTTVTLDLTDSAAAGDACVSCDQPGKAAGGQRVATLKDGTTLWACFGGGCYAHFVTLYGDGS